MKAEEFIKRKNLNLKVTISGVPVPVKALGNDMYNLMEEFAEHKTKHLQEENERLKELIKEAYTDGFSDSRFDFDIENYE